MTDETIHLQANPLNKRSHIFLLFIPAIIFAILVAFLFSKSGKNQTATLGIQTEQP